MEATLSEQDLTDLTRGSQEYDGILRRYGEAMRRICQLETQVRGTGLHDVESIHSDGEAPLQQRSPEHKSLLTRIEALEGSVGTSPGDEPKRRGGGTTNQRPPGDTPEQQQHRSEAANLRLQVAGLNTKLTQTEAELKELRNL